MKGNHKRVISTLLIMLLISTQPAVMAWADSAVPADHLLGDDEKTGKKNMPRLRMRTKRIRTLPSLMMRRRAMKR